MHTMTSSTEDQESDPLISSCSWWRSSREFKDNDHRLGPRLTHLSNLTPRLKVLREMERLALIAPEGLNELRHKLVAYRSGDFWLPTGGVKREDMAIPPIITVVLMGMCGSGKSSLVNLMYSVLGRSGLIPFSQTSNESSRYTTMYLEEHNVLRSLRSGFCVYDTRGIDMNQMKEGLDEVLEWMGNGVRHYQLCFRPGDNDFKREALVTPMMGNARFKTRKVNCVLMVANMAQICDGIKSGDLKLLEATKDLLHCPALRKSSESPILILTHGDELSPEERIMGRLKISDYLGVAETTGLYDIPCLTEQGILPEESDPVTAYALAEVVYRALLQADRAHLPKKKLRDWISLFISWLMCSTGSFFALLAYFFSKLGRSNKLKT